jgi:drug/metabolite transporter (DMT)-like permease
MNTASAPILSPEQAARRELWLGYGFAAAGAFLFSSKGIAIKLAYAEGIDAETLLALRILLAMPIYILVGAITLIRQRRARQAPPAAGLVMRIILVGLLGYWISSYLDFLGLETISAQFERMILFTYPLWVVVFGAAFFGQKVRPRALIALVVAYAGLALMFSQFAASSPTNIVFGVSVVLCAAVTFAMYQLIAKGLIERVGSGLFTCIAMIAAGVAVTIHFALTHPMSMLIVSPKLFGYGLFLAIGATVLPTFFLNAALQRIPAASNATIGMLSPVGTILLAMVILDEWLTPIEWLGAAMVIAGIAWFTLSDRRRPAGTERPQAAKSP